MNDDIFTIMGNDSYRDWRQMFARGIRSIAPPDHPKVVTLCGSTRFMDAFIQAARDETLKGNIVISVGLFGHQEAMDMEGVVKKNLDVLHFRKIDMADEILVLNVGGYIGFSTQREIYYATAMGKVIRYLEMPK